MTCSAGFLRSLPELERLPDVVMDGELVMLDPSGHSKFYKLRRRCAMRDAST
jgi:ATP-dependent DNA ligase